MSEKTEKDQSGKKSKKVLPVVIAGVVLVLGGIVAYVFLKPSQDDIATSENKVELGADSETKSGSQSGDETFTGKLKDALSLGKSMKCEWSNDQGASGVSYIKNNMVHAEMTNNNQKGYVISKDNCTYIWNEGETEGIMMCAEPEEVEDEEMEVPESFSWEVPGVSYSCVPTVINDSKFTLPTSVTFKNPMEMMGGMDLPEGEDLP